MDARWSGLLLAEEHLTVPMGSSGFPARRISRLRSRNTGIRYLYSRRIDDSCACYSLSGAGEWILTYQVEQKKRLQTYLKSTTKRTLGDTRRASRLPVPENTPSSNSAKQTKALSLRMLVSASPLSAI